MSYIRRSLTSDLYTYESDKGLECSACWLHETERWWATIILNSTEEAVEHVREHITAGHRVPDGLVEDVQNRVELVFVERALREINREWGEL